MRIIITTFYLLMLAVLIVLAHIRLVSAMAPESENACHKEFLPRYDVVKIFSMGNERLLADFYWLSFIQYFGDNQAREVDGNKHAYDYLDLITRLDPSFMQAYWLSAFAIGGEAHQPDVAAKIIDRGIALNRDNWEIYFAAGANQYLYKRDMKRAADYYMEGSKLPGAPSWMAQQAKVMLAKIPMIIKEIRVWTDVYNSKQGRLVVQTAKARLIGLWTSVYKHAPNKQIKDRAQQELSNLGVRVES